MNRFLKYAATPTLALGAAIALANVAHAGEYSGGQSDAIVVTSASAMDSWQDNATRRLNRALDHDPAARGAAPAPGVVQVAFSLDANGRPADIALLGNSSDRAAARSATLAVRRMGDLSDVPVTNPGAARFLANVIFADDRKQRRELSEGLARSERTRTAQGRAETVYIVFGG